MSNLQHIKGSRTKVLNTFPVKDFGNDGDIVISRIKGKGVFLCSKAGGMWYAANQMEELKKVGKARADSLSVNKLQVNGMLNAELLSDKFLINENGVIKYRTGEEVVGDLSIPINNIAYKTAYCSLGQYSDKDSCESNGGTWYYSENDSHDSISSTPENQLLTVGQSIGGVDAESTLTYDGSTLEIKRNTDYDDNWQTSAQTSLLKLSYDSSNSAIFGVGSSGDLTLQPDGNLILSLKSGGVKILDTDNSADYIQMDVSSTGGLTITTTDAASGLGVGYDADIILVSDGDIELKASDALSAKINFSFIDGLGTKDDLFTFSGGGISTVMRLAYSADAGDYSQIETAASGATKITTVDDGAAVGHLTLDVDGDVILDPVSGITKFYYNGDTDDLCTLTVAANGATTIATNDSDGAAGNLKIDADGAIELESTSDITLDAGGNNLIDSAGGRTQFHVAGTPLAEIQADGSSNLILYEQSGASSDDYFKIMCFTNGETVINTVDAAAEAAHLKFAIDGSFLIKEKSGAGADVDGFGQIWIKDTDPTELWFTGDDGDDIQITSGTAMAGGSTQYWNQMLPGYTTNKTSTTNYYTFYRGWYENWSNADSSPTTISDTDTYAAFFIAPRAGTITNIKIQGYTTDTGATDPFTFYFYKGAMVANADSMNLSAMVNSGTITPPAANKTWISTVDFSSSNDFAEDDCLYVFWKKDSNSGSQDVYWQMNVSGEYS